MDSFHASHTFRRKSVIENRAFLEIWRQLTINITQQVEILTKDASSSTVYQHVLESYVYVMKFPYMISKILLFSLLQHIKYRNLLSYQIKLSKKSEMSSDRVDSVCFSTYLYFHSQFILIRKINQMRSQTLCREIKLVYTTWKIYRILISCYTSTIMFRTFVNKKLFLLYDISRSFCLCAILSSVKKSKRIKLLNFLIVLLLS